MRKLGVALALLLIAGLFPHTASAAGLGTITGRVVDGLGAGVGEVCVTAERADEQSGDGGTAVTAADGTYTMTDVQSGRYFVKFDPRCLGEAPYAVEWFNNKRNASTADVVEVVEPLTTPNVNAVLEAAGSISGTVKSKSGTPLAGICVQVDDDRHKPTVTTDSQGRYRVYAEAGRWKVGFATCESPWATQYYNGQSSWFDAGLVEVRPAADTSNINASLGRWSTISGTVTERATGKPVPGTCASAWGPSGLPRIDTVTDALGRYTVTRLPEGEWRVQLGTRLCAEHAWDGPLWVAQYWKDVTDGNQGTPLFTDDADAITGIDAKLDRPGGISGRVTDAAGLPVEGIGVEIRGESGTNGGGTATTDAEGRYRVSDLPTGYYSVRFGEKGDLMPVYYKDGDRWTKATLVGVKNNVETPGIDQVMRVGGRLRGRLTDTLGNPVQASVVATRIGVCCSEQRMASPDGAGFWELRGLRPGQYSIQYWAQPPLARGWYKGAANLGSATYLNVVVGENPPVDDQLRKRGRIEGRITDDSGHSLVGACVTAENRLDDPSPGNAAGTATTRSDGTYTLYDLAPGTYTLRIAGCQAGNYGTEERTATVADGLTTPDVDHALAPGGAIAGTVTGPDNQPVHYVPVVVSSGGLSFRQYTTADGKYDIRDLTPGQWTVQFAACGSTLHDGEYYSNSPTAGGATPITVAAGSTKTASAKLEDTATTPPRCRKPSPPTNLSVTRTAGEAVIRWSPPADNGNGDIHYYTIRLAPSGKRITAEGREHRLTGPAAEFTGFAIRAEIGGMNGSEAVWGETPPPEPAWEPPPSPPGSGGGGSGGGGGGGSSAHGYWMVDASGRVYAFGGAPWLGDAPTAGVAAVDIEPAVDKQGYLVVDALGRVFAFGTAAWRGNAGGLLAPGESATSLSATPDGKGYWIFTSRGRAIPFGTAGHFGDMSGVALNGPVLDSVPTPTGKGYYMVGSDGGVFAFGDAVYRGSMGGVPLNAPVQSLVPDSDGTGYWLVASDGGIFGFQADFYGSTGGWRLNRPVTGMVGYPQGYLMVAEDGGIFSFGNAPYSGSLGSNPPSVPVTAVAAYG